MPTYLTQMILTAATGLPEDSVINTWHCNALTDADAVQFASDVLDFYAADAPVAGEAFQDYMSQALTGEVTQKIFDLSDPTPRVPVAVQTYSLTIPTLDAGLPEQVAVCLSYKAHYIGGINVQSQRGRVYLGPLASGALSGATAGNSNWQSPCTIKQSLRDLIAELAGVLLALNVPDRYWVVHSPTLNQSFEVIGGWVDNGLDSQRRRAYGASARTLW